MVDTPQNRDNDSHHLFNWAKLGGQIVEDLSRGILGFIPNGLDLVYERCLKPFPLIGRCFSHRWVEQVFKLCSGITIGQGITTDLGRFAFRPIGFALGTLFGLIFLRSFKNVPAYEGQLGKSLYSLSGFTIGGALAGIGLLMLAQHFGHLIALQFPFYKILGLAAAFGAAMGLIAKTILLFATSLVNHANAANAWKNMQRAKELNVKLILAAKQKAKSRILGQAQDIIQQMNGAQSQQHLDEFLAKKYDVIASGVYKKIERHFNYLTDRVCHGDINALKRLQMLNTARATQSNTEKNAFSAMLDRIFNARAVFKLKDDVDTTYDRWHYEFLQKNKE